MVGRADFVGAPSQIQKRVSKADGEERHGHGKVLFQQGRWQKGDYEEYWRQKRGKQHIWDVLDF